MALELQRPAVLRNRSDDLLGCPVRKTRVDLERHGDLSTDLSNKVSNDFVGNAARITEMDALIAYLQGLGTNVGAGT